MKFECGCEFELRNGKPFFDPYKIRLDCPATYELISSGKTIACFQMDSQLGRQYSKKLKPEKMEHIAALGAILRPGCMQALDENGVSITDHYCRRKNGEEEVKVYHPALEPILRSSYQNLIYQEQAIHIAKDLAGFNLKDADLLRKAMGQKIPELMSKIKTQFLEGCIKVGKVNEKEAAHIFDWIQKSQRYGFNLCIYGKEFLKGHEIPIEEMWQLKKDWWAYSITQSKDVIKNQIVDIRYIGKRKIYNVILGCGSSIKVTENHKFPTENGEKKLSDLKEGDFLFYVSEKYALWSVCYKSEIKSIEYWAEDDVYDIEMQGPHHNFITNQGIVTSNSHSVAYGINGYQTAYAKAHFPVEFYKANLKAAKGKQKQYDRIRLLVNDAKLFNVEVLPPTILSLKRSFHIYNNTVRFGISDIKGLGEKEFNKLHEIVKGKNLENMIWFEILSKIFSKLNKTAVENIINSGGVSHIDKSRREMIYEYKYWRELKAEEIDWINEHQFSSIIEAFERLADYLENFGKRKLSRASKIRDFVKVLKNPTEILEDDENYLITKETELLGLSFSHNKADEYIPNANCTCKQFIDGFASKYIVVCGELLAVRTTKTKKGKNPGKEMAFLQLSDGTAELDNIVIFFDAYDEFKHLLTEGGMVYLCGKRGDFKNPDSLIVEKVYVCDADANETNDDIDEIEF